MDLGIVLLRNLQSSSQSILRFLNSGVRHGSLRIVLD